MPKRAAVCVGIDRAGSMPALRAAASGARAFADWARGQGCAVTLLTDDGGARVALVDVHDAVQAVVAAGGCEQLLVYFAGHGFLLTQGAEFWLLSRAPENPNEAVNVLRSVEDARNSGIPHVVFISDACRSHASGPPLSGVIGGTLFAGGSYRPQRGEIDTLYATQPGDPSWEIPAAQQPNGYEAVFTTSLLEAIQKPRRNWIEEVPAPNAPSGTVRFVVTTRTLKPHLIGTVPVTASDFNIRIRQTPEVRVETDYPKYFAEVDPKLARSPLRSDGEAASVEASVRAVGGQIFSVVAPGRGSDVRGGLEGDSLGLEREVARVALTQGRLRFETRTGLTVHGARVLEAHAQNWRVDEPFQEAVDASWNLRLHPSADSSGEGTSVLLRLQAASGRIAGALVAGLENFVGTLVVDGDGRVAHLNYVPSENSPLFDDYRHQSAEFERLKAYLAVAAQHGRLDFDLREAKSIGDRLRLLKHFDPILGIAAAYAYVQAGNFEQVADILRFLASTPGETPVPFDIAMLAARFPEARKRALAQPRVPFAPLLAQGWAYLAPGDPLHLPLHGRLRPHLVPALWTTFDQEGIEIALEASRQGETP